MILLRTKCEPDELAERAIAKAADDFVRAGVTLTATDWLLAEPMERNAIIKARQRHDVEKLLLLVSALRNPSELIPLLGEAMGDEARDRLLATQGAETAAERLRTGGEW